MYQINQPSFGASGTYDFAAPPISRDPVAMPRRMRGTIRLLGPAISFAVLTAVVFQLGSLDFAQIWRMVPTSPLFWLLTSLAAMVLRRRLFSLPWRELRFVVAVHLVRIVATAGLAAWMWHMVLPDVPLGWWVLLSTIRMLLSRLPFLPNKDLVFAGIAVFLVGHALEVGALMAMMASLILATHLVLGAALMTGDLMSLGRPK